MKNIKINEKQKENLLEMCKELFPEWTIIQFGNQSNYYLENEEMLDFYNEKEQLTIHWFEFCTKIGHKIFSRKQFYYQSEKFITFMKIMCLQDKTKLKHPVDYLYEEFKKLN